MLLSQYWNIAFPQLLLKYLFSRKNDLMKPKYVLNEIVNNGVWKDNKCFYYKAWNLQLLKNNVDKEDYRYSISEIWQCSTRKANLWFTQLSPEVKYTSFFSLFITFNGVRRFSDGRFLFIKAAEQAPCRAKGSGLEKAFSELSTHLPRVRKRRKSNSEVTFIMQKHYLSKVNHSRQQPWRFSHNT